MLEIEKLSKKSKLTDDEKKRRKYLDGYITANSFRSDGNGDYYENLCRAFRRVNKFNKLSKEKQKKILDDPRELIHEDKGFIDFYLDTKKKKGE